MPTDPRGPDCSTPGAVHSPPLARRAVESSQAGDGAGHVDFSGAREMADKVRLIREVRTRLQLAGWSVEALEVEIPGGGPTWRVRAARGDRVVLGEAATPAGAWAEVVMRAAVADTANGGRPRRRGRAMNEPGELEASIACPDCGCEAKLVDIDTQRASGGDGVRERLRGLYECADPRCGWRGWISADWRPHNPG